MGAPSRNLAISGASGTGKSHFVEALAHTAIEADLRVSWFTLETLTATIGKAKADGSVARTVARICGCDLIVVDDIGMLPAGHDAAEAFYRVVDAPYERRSVAVTSNLHSGGFDSIMPKPLATATVDGLRVSSNYCGPSADDDAWGSVMQGTQGDRTAR
jgi:DNA replication protein DnaC